MPLVVSDLTPLLQVFDMKRALAFYRDILGFRIEAQSEPGDDFDWGLLRLGPAALMLNTTYERDKRPANPDFARRAAHIDTRLFFYCPNLDEAYHFLIARARCEASRRPALWHAPDLRLRSRRLRPLLPAERDDELTPRKSAKSCHYQSFAL